MRFGVGEYADKLTYIHLLTNFLRYVNTHIHLHTLSCLTNAYLLMIVAVVFKTLFSSDDDDDDVVGGNGEAS